MSILIGVSFPLVQFLSAATHWLLLMIASATSLERGRKGNT